MHLASDKFYIGSFNYRPQADADLITAPLYSYETVKALYDVLPLDGRKYYRVNMGPWANTIDKITPVHAEIERHFKI